MSTSGRTPPTRKERRAAERTSGKAPVAATSQPVWRSPVVLISAVALAVGVMIVAIIALGAMNKPAAAIKMPPVLIAQELRDGRSLGAADAPVQVEVYEDPQCPGCGSWSREKEPLLIAGPITDGTVRLTYRDMAFLGQESTDAAVGMRAAEQLAGKFWDFNSIVFENQSGENQGAFSRERLGEMAVKVGLDKAAFLALLDDPALIAAVKAEMDGGSALGVRSTPTVIINGTIQPNVPSWEELKVAIAAAAASSTPEATPVPSVTPAPMVSTQPVPSVTPAPMVSTQPVPSVTPAPMASATAGESAAP